jgi:hypothetical protein
MNGCLILFEMVLWVGVSEEDSKFKELDMVGSKSLIIMTNHVRTSSDSMSGG